MPKYNSMKKMSADASKPEMQMSEAEVKAELAKKRLKAGSKGGSR
jgi:hypothetical protein